MNSNLLSKIENRISELPQGLQEHIARTRNLARDIASFYGTDLNRCDIAVAAHDIVRHLKADELINCAKQYAINIAELDYKQPILLHGPIAAKIIEIEYFCKDEDIIAAVRYHTTGRPNMTDIEKIVFIADKVEPMKVTKNPFLKSVEALIYKDVDSAIKKYLSVRSKMLFDTGAVIHPLAIDTWNSLIDNKSFN